jgi:hypothetical protein
LPIYHIGAHIHQLHHSPEQFRRILEIRIYDEDPLATADVESGSQCELMAMITSQFDTNDALVLCIELQDNGPRSVQRTVVNQDEFVLLADCIAAGRR